MAQSTLTLPGVASAAAAPIAYTNRACDGMNVQYVGTNADDSLAAPRIIDVKLAVKNPGIQGNDRVEVSFKHTVLDELNAPHTGSVTVTLSMPRVAEWTAEKAVSLLKQAASYLGGVGASVTGGTDTSGYPAKWAECLIP